MPSEKQVQKAFGLFPGNKINSKFIITDAHIEENVIRPYHVYSYEIFLHVIPTSRHRMDTASVIKSLSTFLHQSHSILAQVNTYLVTVIPESVQVQPLGNSYLVRARAEGQNLHHVPY